MKIRFSFIIAIFLLWNFTTNAQIYLSDDFLDNNFNQNPTWTGDTLVFIINSSGQLQLNNSGNAATSALVTPLNLTSLDSIEWRFYIKLSFAGSSSNYARVYLASNSADIKSALNGYYLQFGESGANDAIELFKQTGSVSTSVCRGTNAAISSSVNASVRVLRKTGGIWQIWVDYSGGTNYVLDAQGVDNTFNGSQYFGVLCTYTSSNATKFYFDNFLVKSIEADTVKPTLVSATAINATQVDVLFSEAVDTVSAKNTSNYQINNGIGIPATATVDNINKSLVHLLLSNSLTTNSSYQLTVNNIKDLNNNTILSNSSINFSYIVVSIPQPYEVVINEIYADNSSTQNFTQINGKGKFIELYNRSNKNFDLNGWKISANTSSKTLPSYILKSGNYVVLCPSADTAFYRNYGPVLGFGTSLTIAQSGSTITLLDNNNRKIDQIIFTDAWYNDNVKKDGAYTLERINPNDTCKSQRINWSGANSVSVGGSPGYQNTIYSLTADIMPPSVASATIVGSNLLQICFSESMDSASLISTSNYFINNGITVTSINNINTDFTCVTLATATPFDSNTTYQVLVVNVADCRGNAIGSQNNQTFGVLFPANQYDVVINEIMADPTPEVLLPNAEFVELYNRTNKRILLNNWKLKVGTSSKTIQNSIIEPNSYLLLCGIADTSLLSPFGKVAFTSSALSLTNGGATLELLNNLNKSIDKVTYSSAWYNNPIKDDGGWSLERINPYDNCSSFSNWSASNDLSGGTPGRINSIADFSLDVLPPVFSSVSLVNKFTLLLTFNETLDSINARNPLLYQIKNATNGNLINVTNAKCLAPYYNKVLITLADSMLLGQLYYCQVTNISDCKGNIQTGLQSLEIGRYRLPKPYEIVINEIMADPTPKVNLPEYEYVELYNRSNETLSLNKVELASGSSKTILPNISIKPGQYLLIIDDAAGNYYTNISNKITVSSLISIPNDGGTLILRDSLKRIIHSVSYSSQWYNSTVKRNGGWSLEQIDYNNPCAEETNWKASENINGGTPGAINSVYAVNPDNTKPRLARVNIKAPNLIEAIFTESLDSVTINNPLNFTIDNGIGNPISVNPNEPQFKSVDLLLNQNLDSTKGYILTVTNTIKDCMGNTLNTDFQSVRLGIPRMPKKGDVLINEFLPDPADGGSEFVELYNKSDKIIDLKYLLFLTFTSSGSLRTTYPCKPEGYLMFPGDYIVLTKKATGVTKYFNVKNDLAVVETNIPSLSNSGGTITIGDINNKELDRIDYTSSMHYPLLNSTKGVTLERISLVKETNTPSNWHSAAESVGFGTPTAPNSQLIDGGLSGNFVLSSEIFSPDNDGYQDVLSINYTLDKPGLLANVTIVDGSGNQVKSLIKNELLGTDGLFLWDGLNDHQQRASIGPYIILIELTDLDGTIRRIKKSVIVATKL